MRRAAVLGFLLVASALLGQRPATDLAKPATAPTPARLTRELELPARRRAAIDGLLRAGAPALEPLLLQARHPDLAVAHVALQVLAALEHDALPAVPKLQQMAVGDTPHARAAAWCLARLPVRGTFLVPSMEEGVVRELDAEGKEIGKIEKVGKVWSATRLASGNLLVADLDHGACEYDKDGKRVWEWQGKVVYTAERLIDGNTLCVEYGANRVVEVDPAGKEVWVHEKSTPMSAARLPFGTTLIGDYGSHSVSEVDRAGAVLWTIADQQSVYSVRWLRDGTVLLRNSNVANAKVQNPQGETLREVKTLEAGSDVVLLPDGSIQTGQHYVRRCAADGSERWQFKVGGWVGRVNLR